VDAAWDDLADVMEAFRLCRQSTRDLDERDERAVAVQLAQGRGSQLEAAFLGAPSRRASEPCLKTDAGRTETVILLGQPVLNPC
jgi:hypothetical protein